MGADTAHRLPNVAQRSLLVAAAVIVDLDRHIDRRSVQVARFLILLRQARKTKRHPRSINVTRNAAHDWRTVLYFDTYLRFVLNVRKTRKHRLGIRPVAIIDLNPCEVRRTVSGNNRRVVQIDRAKPVNQPSYFALGNQVDHLGVLVRLQAVGIFNRSASAAATLPSTTARTDDRLGQAATTVMHTNIVGEEGVVREHCEVIDRLATLFDHAQDRAQVARTIDQRVVVFHHADMREGVVLVQHPMVRRDAQLAAPILDAQHFFQRVLMHLLDLRYRDLAAVVERQNLVANLERFNRRFALRGRNHHTGREAATAALAHHISRHACCLVSIPAEITAEPTIIRP